MGINELRKQLEELSAKRKSLIDSIDGAASAEALSAIELDLRKTDIQIAELRARISEEEQKAADPAVRSDKDDIPETRTMRPIGADIIRNNINIPDERGQADSDIEYRKAFMDFVLRKKPIPAELRAGEVTKTTDVSAVIPTVLVNRIIEELAHYGMILPLITRTNYKGGVNIPKASTRPKATWVAEGEGSDKQKKTVTEYIAFSYYKLRCAIAMTLEVTVVTLPIFEDTFVRQVVEAMHIELEKSIISGTGTGQPKGILTETPNEGQKLETDTINYQLIVNAEAAIPAQYDSGVLWCMTKKTFFSFVGMTDANGQPIARVNAGINGRPEYNILGRDVVIAADEYMDSWSDTLEDGKVFAFLYNFKDYILNSNLELTTKFYEDNDTDDTVFKAVMLADGKCADINSLVQLAKKNSE